MNMQDTPEQPDDVDVCLRHYAESRRTFAANAPDLHEADIRRLAAEASREWNKRAPVAASLWEKLSGFIASLSTPQWSVAAATAVILLFFAVWLPLRDSGGEGQHVTKVEKVTRGKPVGSGSQVFAMVATINRGETREPDAITQDPADVHSTEVPTHTPAQPQGDYRHFDLTLNPDKKQVVLKFSDGTILTGSLQADDEGQPDPGHEAMSYAVSASGSGSQQQPIGFKGVLDAVQDPASPKHAKEVSLRGILTENQQEIQINAGIKK